MREPAPVDTVALDLAPAERMARLIADFFLPPIDLDTKYEDQLRAVTAEMADA